MDVTFYHLISPGSCASVKHHPVDLALMRDEQHPMSLATGSVAHPTHTNGFSFLLIILGRKLEKISVLIYLTFNF